MIFNKYKELYFVGIGGSGMSGIAEILNNLGYTICGSDINPGSTTEYLEELGVTIFPEHDGGNLGSSNVVVISSAVTDDNPEVLEARRRGIPIIKRAEMLGELMRLKYAIGISGTHGKTTTTSMLGKILEDAALDPTVIVGGIVAGKGSGATLGTGDYLVAEADEYDRSILAMFPSMAVVLNIEPDHLECYDGIEDLHNSFLRYMNRVPFFGMVVYNIDDPVLFKLKNEISRASVSFGQSHEADYQMVEFKQHDSGSSFTLFHHGDKLGEIILNVPGQHNACNALAAIASAIELEVPFDTVAESMASFCGVNRRFEIKGIVNDIMLVDDYAHHPTELKATLDTAKLYKRRIVAVFQPHLFSRTQKFYKEFAECLTSADIALVSAIFPAREKPVEGVTSDLIVNYAKELGMKNIEYFGTKDNAVDAIIKVVQPGDMILTIGAGSITRINNELLQALEKIC